MTKYKMEDGSYFDPEVIESLIFGGYDQKTGINTLESFYFTLNSPIKFNPKATVKSLDVVVSSTATEDRQLLQHLLQKTR